MELHCKKCNLFLGDMEKGKLRNGTVLLCSACWKQAEIAISIADMVSSSARDFSDNLKNPFDGKGAVDGLKELFGMNAGRGK